MRKICSGNIITRKKENIPFSIVNDFNIKNCLAADIEWNKFYLTLFEYCEKKGFKVEDLGIEDLHWSWMNKAKVLNSTQYEWFFLIAEDKIQATMIVFYPEHSRFDDESIVYIDFLAVAPWNRNIFDKNMTHQFHKRRFKGLGTLLIRKANFVLGKKLKYREGFSLHTLPKALPFYKKLGMVDFGPDPKKEYLHYLEMENKVAKEFINGR